MSGYEQRLAADKAEIRKRVFAVGKRVQAAIADATKALLTKDRETSSRIALGDLPINREIRDLDALCHKFVARHLPSAGHLRFVSSVLQMNVALERIGDYAVTIAREGVQLNATPSEAISSDIEALCDQACEILGDALLAFSERDADLARKTRPRAKAVNRSYSQYYRYLTRNAENLSLEDAFAIMTVFHRLDRVADQAKNVSEETLFELTGEIKAPKKFRVLFVDDDGSAWAPIAVAIARKGYPDSGEYACASIAAPKGIGATARQAATELGIEIVDATCAPFNPDEESLERYDVVVALTNDPTLIDRTVQHIPYATSILRWAHEVNAEQDAARFQLACRDLTTKVSDLMTLLRGPNAH